MAMNGGNVGVGVTIRAVDRASATFRGIRASFKGFREGFKKYTDIKDPMMAGIFRGSIGVGLRRAGAHIRGINTQILNQTADIRQSLRQVRMATGATADELERLRVHAASAAVAETGTTANDAARALGQLAKETNSATEAEKFLIPTLRYAKMTEQDSVAAAASLTDIMGIFKRNADDATLTTDQLAWAMKQFNITGNEVFDLFRGVAGGATLAGQSFEDTALAIGLMKKVFPDATRAAMAANMALSQLSDVNVQKEMKQLGVEVKGSDDKLRGLGDIMAEVASKTEDMTGAQRANALAQIFGARGAGGMSIILDQLRSGVTTTTGELLTGADAMRYLQEQMKGSAGESQKMADSMVDAEQKYAAALSRFPALFSDAAESLRDMVKVPISKVLNHLADLLQAFSPQTRKMILGVTAALGTVLSVAGGFVVLTAVMRAFGLSFFGVALGMVKVALAAAILLPLVAGLGIGFFALYKAATRGSEGFGLTLKNLRQKVSLAFKGMVQIVSEGKLSKAMETELGKAENQGVLRFLRGFERFKERFGAFWDGIKRGFEQGVEALSRSPAFARFRRSFDGLIKLFTGSDAQSSQEELAEWGKKGEAAGVKLAGLGEVAADIGTKLLDFTKQAAEAFAGFTADDFAKGIDTAVGAFYKLWDALSVVGTALSAIYNTLKLILSVVAEVIDNLSDLISYQWIADKRAPKIFTEEGWRWTADAAGDLADTFSGQAEHMASAEQRGAPTRFQMMNGGKTREQAIADLVERQRKIATWAETPATEWQKIRGKEGGGALSFAEAPETMRREWMAKFDNLARQIEKLGGRPIEIKLDGKKVGEGVENAGASEGARNLGGGGTVRTFAAAPAPAAGR